MKFIAREDSAYSGDFEIEADSMEDALEMAEDEWRSCYDSEDETIRVGVIVTVEGEEMYPLVDGVSESISIEIEPDEPPCVDGDHKWQAPHAIVGGLEENPGVFGNGGGVIYHEICLRCGCRKTVNTWATDPNTGQQGLETLKYEPNFLIEHYETQREDS